MELKVGFKAFSNLYSDGKPQEKLPLLRISIRPYILPLDRICNWRSGKGTRRRELQVLLAYHDVIRQPWGFVILYEEEEDANH